MNDDDDYNRGSIFFFDIQIQNKTIDTFEIPNRLTFRLRREF